MKDLKLGTKLLAGGLLAVILPVIIIGVFSVYRMTTTINSLSQENMRNLSESLSDAMDIALSEQVVTARNISFSNAVVAAADKVARDGAKNSQAEIAAVDRELNKITAAEGDRVSSILLVGKDHVAFAGKFKGLNLKGREYLEKTFKGEFTVGSVVLSRAHGRPVCTVTAPIYALHSKEITGAVVLAMETKFFTNVIDKVKLGKTGFAFIVDENGFYITHPLKENILKVSISKVQGMQALMKVIKTGREGVAEYETDGVHKIAAVTPIPITRWSVVVNVSSSELFAPATLNRNVIIIVGIIFLVLASLFFYLFAKNITLPLTALVGTAHEISRGDLTVQVGSQDRQDEVGDLARSFAHMTQSLQEKARVAERIAEHDLTVSIESPHARDILGNAIARMIEKQRKQIQEIIEGVNVLATAGSEIMASVSQLTSGAAETSTAVSETTTTVEEVKQTAEVSSQKARHVSELGQKTFDISRAGLKSIEDMMNGMNRIKDQVEAIADMVVRLSEQSQAIGEIISTVNDLAEQSNLLAVNASIEAAKAGEHGRGFAVVAQEIRSLAEQSKQATAQVRNILFDVQKSISSAVMATEQGSRAVEEGVKLSGQAGDAIESLSESVQEATNASLQIAASSQQQLVGMDQVVSAMENIKEASTQTASSTKQTERAAHDLHNLGQRLQDVVKQYKI